MRLWAEVKLQALTRCVHLSWDKVTGMCGYVMSMNVRRLAMVVLGGIVDRRLVLLVRVLKSGPVRFFSLFGRQLNWIDSFSLPKGVGLATGLKATSCDQLPPSCDQLRPVLDYQSLNMVIISCDWSHSVSSGT